MVAIGANSLALAQPFPSKPLRIVAPFPPSGSIELREENLPEAERIFCLAFGTFLGASPRLPGARRRKFPVSGVGWVPLSMSRGQT